MIKNEEEIKSAARIDDIVGEFVTLRQRGSNLVGLCPFHGERSPSFSVNIARGIFKCFGCDKSGDAVAFLIEHKGVTYPEALEYIAKRYNVAVEYTQGDDPQFDEKEQLRATLVAVQMHFEQHAAKGREYFSNRGLTPDTMAAFGIGWCQSSTVPNIPAEMLQKAGISTANRLYFTNRVTLPIRNEKGQVVSFAGRTTTDAAPKYLNGAESLVFSKSKILFGLWENGDMIRKCQLAVLVEGYADVMSLYQNGCSQAVASCGTSLTADQCALLSRYTKNLVILYDGDEAGQKAAHRAALTAYPHFENLRVVLLDGGADPDDAARTHGIGYILNLIYTRWIDAGVYYCTRGEKWSTQAGKRAIAARLRELLASIDDTRRPALVCTLAEHLGVSEAALMRFVFPVISEAHATAYASFRAQFKRFEDLVERRARWCIMQQEADISGLSEEARAAHLAKLERIENEISVLSDLRGAVWAIEEIYLSHLQNRK